MQGALQKLEQRIERRFARVLALLFVLALCVRSVALVEIASSPCAVQHRWVDTDMHFFDEWANKIAAGDVLSAQVGHPYLDWHARIAQRYFDEEPQVRARLAAGGADPARALWNEWYGGAQFHQEPLYPYLVAATYALVGPRPVAVFAWQVLLGACSVVLLGLLARHAFGALVGALSALLAALCAPLVFHELVLLRTTTIVFLSLLLAWLALRACERPTWKRAALFGVTIGLALLTNSTFAPLALGLLVLLGWSWRRSGAGFAGLRAPIATLLVSLVVVLAPAWLRNRAVGAPTFSTSSVGALAFICANAGDFEPRTGFAADSKHLTTILRESENRLLAAIPATLRTHGSVSHWVAQLGEKIDWSARWYEIPNNENLYAFERYSATLRVLPVTFLALAPLALVGLALAWRQRARAASLYLLFASALVPLLAFYVLSRFRAPLVAAAIPFAALTLVELARALSSRAWLRASAIGGATLALGAWTARPLPADVPLLRPADWTAPFLTFYMPESEAAARAGDWAKAARILEASLADEPDFVRALSRDTLPAALGAPEREWIAFSAQIHEQLAIALRRAGRAEAAVPHEHRAQELRAWLKAAAPGG